MYESLASIIQDESMLTIYFVIYTTKQNALHNHNVKQQSRYN